MVRIKDNMSMMDVATAMCEGNPGALQCIIQLIKTTNDLDSGFLTLCRADDLGVYGANLYVLWADVCNKDAYKLMALFRAEQLGIIKKERFDQLIAGPLLRHLVTDQLFPNIDDIVKQVEDVVINKIKEQLEPGGES
jgi:hypothetical protein